MFETSGELLFMLYSCICASKEFDVLISILVLTKERDAMAQPSLQPKSTKNPFQNLIKRILPSLKSASQKASHSVLQPGLQPESGITFFPLRFEEYLYTHWYLFSIGLYLLLMILGVSLDVAYAYYFQHPGFYYLLYDFHSTYFYLDLTDWIYILGVV